MLISDRWIIESIFDTIFEKKGIFEHLKIVDTFSWVEKSPALAMKVEING